MVQIFLVARENVGSAVSYIHSFPSDTEWHQGLVVVTKSDFNYLSFVYFYSTEHDYVLGLHVKHEYTCALKQPTLAICIGYES